MVARADGAEHAQLIGWPRKSEGSWCRLGLRG